MAGGSDGDKTEKATPKRREESRNKGQVAVSMDLNGAIHLMVGVALLYYIGVNIYHQLSGSLMQYLGQNLATNRTVNDAMALSEFNNAMFSCIRILTPFLGVIAFMMIAANILQVGLKFSTETLKIKFDKLNPINGIKKLFSLRSVMKLLWALLKVGVVSLTVWLSVRGKITEMGPMGDSSLIEILIYFFAFLFKVLFRVSIILLILAFFDWAYQKWQYEKDLMMTKEEVKEENKQALGDPKIKGRIRQVQMEMARKRMMSDVPEATVVVTNPTHFAVAIKYERGEMEAPLVVAKGMNLIAEKIKSIARDHDIPLVENKMLAQTLYRTVEVGDEVPPRLYRAVAEILTYVYKLKGKA